MSFGAPSSGPTSWGSGAAASASGAQIQKGDDLHEIRSEGIGFHALAGEAKLRLLQTPWPENALPAPTSSLFSVASNKGLLAAVGPDSLVVASTDSIRDAFGSAGDEVKAFTPQLTIPMGTRISQLTFTSDGEFLVISAETGGGLAFYETQGLVSGNTKSAFELPTGGKSVRSLIPNPVAALLAIVTTDGQLMVVDAKTKSFKTGSGGQVLKDGVSCVSWSNKGTQLVAGLGNGAAHQMTPDGKGVAEIPRPAGLDGDQHVSSIMWLENDIFLTVHTPSATEDPGMAPASVYHIIRRQPKTELFMSQALPEVCGPFGMNRSPSFQFMQRLRNFPPAVTDAVIVSSTSSEDVGLFTRSSKPLSNDVPEDQIVNMFTTTTMANDSRRAAVPMGADMTTNTSVIGMCLDLSSKVKVPRPIPGDEIEMSPEPLPALLLLNHEGLLCGWWIVYSDSIRQGTVYPGLIAAGGGQPAQNPATTTSAFGSTAPSTQSTSSFGQSSAFGGSTPSAFGSTAPSAKPAFGGSSFGAPAALGNKSSPWGAPSANNTTTSGSAFGQSSFGQPAFGAPSALGNTNQGTAFGTSGGLGSRPSPWGSSTQSSAAPGAAFGQASALGGQRASPFGSPAQGSSSATTLGSGGGFASFANSGGFAAAASSVGNTASDVLKQTPSTSIFGSSKEGSSAFGSQTTSNAGTGLFGASKQGFALGSSWTNPNPEASNEKAQDKGSSMFGSGFASALNQSAQEATPVSKEADMMSDEEDATTSKPPQTTTTTQNTTPQQTPSLFGSTKTPTPSGGLFGQTPQKPASSPLKDEVRPQEETVDSKAKTETLSAPSIVKSEPTDEGSGIPKHLEEAPLPPDPMSKTSYTPGNSSTSSTGASVTASKASIEEPPLPPDPFQLKPSAKTVSANESPLPEPPTKSKPEASTAPTPERKEPEPTSPEEEAPDGHGDLPESDDGDLDDEGSGVDVAQEIDSAAGPTPDQSPQSSFGLKPGESSIGGSFERLSSLREESSRSLFGEINTSSIPTLNPPQRIQQSPRSPSPVRLGARSSLRADASRSVSAPGVPLRADGVRKVTMGRPVESNAVYPPAFTDQTHREERERLAKQKAQREAEEEQELSDQEDEAVREVLASEVVPTLVLEPFTAHYDYVAGVAKQGIPGQIEKVYRDINSMVDTFGLNSRSVAAFIKGHEELVSNQGRSRGDLEEGQTWKLAEIEDLGAVVDALEEDLVDGQLQDPKAMVSECLDLSRELSRMKAKSNDIKHSINAKRDPQLLESLRTAPLTVEQSTIRHELRAKYTEFQRSLAQGEETISMLKTKLASLHAMSSKANGASKVPTVEAVEKTILKMTSMFEKKSGDIDLLETQMRKFNLFNSPSASREDSPFMTPPQKKIGAAPVTPGSSVNARSFYTPGSRGSGLAASAGASSRKHHTPGKKMVTVADTEAQAYAAKAARKRQVRVLLKEALIASEPSIRTLDDL